ncbi:MAG: cation diffusion facilitator family transporter [Verrucomicrobiota bacterium]
MDPRYRKITQVLTLVLGVHLFLAAGKFFLGWKVGSLSVLSDGVHSLLDGASSVIAILAIMISSRPPDEEHPYGHRKFEVLATLALSGLLLLTCWELAGAAIERLIQPVASPHFSWNAVLFLLGALGIHYSLACYEKDKGEELNSPLLIADSIHARSDFFTTGLALCGIFAGIAGWYWLDAIAAIGIVVVIGIATYSIIHECVNTVAEARRLNPEEVRQVAKTVEGVQNPHAIRSHGMKNDIHLDMHIQIKKELNAEEVYEIENQVTRELKKTFPGLTQVSIRHEPSSLPKDHKDDLFS